MANAPPNTTTRIPTAAQRYYAHPRVGNIAIPASPSAHPMSVSITDHNDLKDGRRSSADEHELKYGGRGEGKRKNKSKARKPPRSTSPAAYRPTRQSARLIKKRTAVLQKQLQDHFLGISKPPETSDRKTWRCHTTTSMADALPALSEGPTSFNSNPADCRFHLPSTVEDQQAVRAAMTPTLFRLQKRGWRGGVVWNSDASYMEACQKCVEAYYGCELVKKLDSSPFDPPSVLILLPWYGKIGDFRNSPNWSKGW